MSSPPTEARRAWALAQVNAWFDAALAVLQKKGYHGSATLSIHSVDGQLNHLETQQKQTAKPPKE